MGPLWVFAVEVEGFLDRADFALLGVVALGLARFTILHY